MNKVKILIFSTFLLLGRILELASSRGANSAPPGGEEFDHLVPHISETCALVREDPSIWPYRAFPYGPLGLEVRKAKSQTEADQARNFFLGVVAAACKIPSAQVTAHFFCGPACPGNRRDHLVRQLAAVRALETQFEGLKGVRLIAVWAPKGELRVNDLFYMHGQAREAIPSPVMGFVPSGDWKPWPSLGSYAQKIGLSEAKIADLSRQMLDIGLSALVRDSSGIRVVGVGIGDNESGLLFLAGKSSPPHVGTKCIDGREYTMVEEVSTGVLYYETS